MKFNQVRNGEYPLCSKSIACEAVKASAHLVTHPKIYMMIDTTRWFDSIR